MATLHPPNVDGDPPREADPPTEQWPSQANPPYQPQDTHQEPDSDSLTQHQFLQQRYQQSPNPNLGSKIFVGGLSWDTDEDSLRGYFEQIGTVLDCVIMRDRHTGHPRGFGFVTFADDDAAASAASRRHDLDGRQVEAKRAVPRNEGTQPAQPFPRQQRYGDAAPAAPQHRHHTTKCKVFVGGLPSGCGVDEFRSYFSQYGDVVEAQVMIDHNTGNSRGFGFVTFGSEDTVNTVVGPGKSNTDHEIMGKCVEVKRAEPKGASSDRRTNREHYNPRGGGNDVSSGATNGSGGGASGGSGGAAGGGTNAAAAAAAAYYSNYPQSLAEQYNAYYNNPQQWQQYFAAMGYNFNAFQQPGYNPYQQYLQAYMNSQGNANGASGASAVPNPPGDAPQNAGPGSGSGGKSMRLSFHVNSCHSFSLKLSL